MYPLVSVERNRHFQGTVDLSPFKIFVGLSSTCTLQFLLLTIVCRRRLWSSDRNADIMWDEFYSQILLHGAHGLDRPWNYYHTPWWCFYLVWFGNSGHTVFSIERILKLCSCLEHLNELYLSDLFFWSRRCRIPSHCSLPLYVFLTLHLHYGNGAIQKNKSAVPVKHDIHNTWVNKIWIITCLPHKRKRRKLT